MNDDFRRRLTGVGIVAKNRKKGLIIALFIVIAAMLFFALFWTVTHLQRKIVVSQETVIAPDTSRYVLPKPVHHDTLSVMEPIKPAAKIVHRPSVAGKRAGDTISKADSATLDSAVLQPADSDTASDEYARMNAGRTRNCLEDTSVLWVYPEPAGGLHRNPITVSFHAKTPCNIEWKFEKDSVWQLVTETAIFIEKTNTIQFKASDSCGKIMEQREEYYEIEIAAVSSLCPGGMDLVKIGATQFCIDRYEWPNQKGQRPLAYISLYEAMDSCFSIGKRLCSSEEWTLACAGPYSAKYPYGQNYEPYACVTNDTAMRTSGSHPECRAFFGAFDMSGNLSEWTSTASVQDRSFNNVMGGFWQSGPGSGCFEKRYSYFPQNRHNPVGFRCCKDVTGGKKK